MIQSVFEVTKMTLEGEDLRNFCISTMTNKFPLDDTL